MAASPCPSPCWACPSAAYGRPSHLSLSHKSELLTLPAVRVGLPDTLDRAARGVALLGGARHAPRLLHLWNSDGAPW